MAPVDIIIDIIERMKREYEDELKDKENNLTFSYTAGKIAAMKALKDQLEGFKRLFN